MPRAPSREGEKMQIAILTPAMTGGLFALLTLILAFFLGPTATDRAERAASDYTALTALLQTPELRALRAQAAMSDGQDDQKTLPQVISDGLSRFGIEYTRFPPGNSKALRPGLEEVKLSIDLKPAPLASIFQFVGFVRDQKKTIKVEGVNFTRKTDSEDSWTATVHFVDYVVAKKA